MVLLRPISTLLMGVGGAMSRMPDEHELVYGQMQ